VNFLFLESSRSWGGQEYRTCLESNWLNAHGHQAWLGCDPMGEVFARASEIGTRIVPFTLTKRFDPLATFRLWKLCRHHDVDIIKTFSSKDHWVALPLYWSGIPLTRARCITDPVGGASRAFIFRYGCSRIIADAPVIKRQLVADNKVPPEKIEVIGSAVDLDRFHPERDGRKFRNLLAIPQESPLIVNIGMIRPDKGQLHLVEAARKVLQEEPAARFVFVGEGTGAQKKGNRLREAIARHELEDRILMAGYRWDIPEILAAADLVVIASVRTEASPIVLREALASGRPVVATRVGDVVEVIRDREHGLLVSPGAEDEMAGAILELVRDRDLAERYGRNGLKLAREKFSFDRMMEEKLRVDTEIVKAARARRNAMTAPLTLAEDRPRA
jgi:glycosyltransferase involved in cell wall biosynthesis